MHPRLTSLLCLALAGCSQGDAASSGVVTLAAVLREPHLLFHDYGSIPHGKAAQHDFVVDTRSGGESLVAIGIQVDCSCARYELLLRDAAGRERKINSPQAENAARPGEVLVARLLIDTVQKEAVDQQALQKVAALILQPTTGARPAERRITVPLQFRFAIDAPVVLQPFATFDFDLVPRSAERQLLTTLRSKDKQQPIKFGPAHCDDPRCRPELTDEGDRTVLRVTFAPGDDAALGVFRALVTVGTDLPDGYEVRIAATGKVVADIVLTPNSKISLGQFDFAVDHPEQFVLVTDHDRRRPAEFVVHQVVDQNGNDSSALFDVRLEPLDGDPRTTRVNVRWRGGSQAAVFRGKLVLAKDRERGPFAEIELVAFHRKR